MCHSSITVVYQTVNLEGVGSSPTGGVWRRGVMDNISGFEPDYEGSIPSVSAMG